MAMKDTLNGGAPRGEGDTAVPLAITSTRSLPQPRGPKPIGLHCAARADQGRRPLWCAGPITPGKPEETMRPSIRKASARRVRTALALLLASALLAPALGCAAGTRRKVRTLEKRVDTLEERVDLLETNREAR